MSCRFTFRSTIPAQSLTSETFFPALGRWVVGKLKTPGSSGLQQGIAPMIIPEYLERISAQGGSICFLCWPRLAMGDALAFDLINLSKDWDEVDTIRNRLREGGKFLNVSKSGGDSSIAECKANSDVLHVLLPRFLLSRMTLPLIDPLRSEVEAIYRLASRDPSESEVDDDSWDIRTMLRFLKRKANRNDPSKDS